MKKLSIFLSVVVLMFAFATVSYAQQLNTSKVISGVTSSMKDKGVDVKIEVEVIQKLDNPAGFYLVDIVFKDMSGKEVNRQKMFTNGDFLAQDFLSTNGMASLMREVEFQASSVDVDVTGLTLAMGNKNAKNIVIEITDFQCPYCTQANSHLNNTLKGRKDVALYLVHMPIKSIHPRAETMAKIYEAGMMMGNDFKNELFTEGMTKLTDAQLVDKYAKKTKDAKEFAKLVASKQVADKLALSNKIATNAGVKSTPSVIINGKLVEGFDVGLIDKAISEFNK